MSHAPVLPARALRTALVLAVLLVLATPSSVLEAADAQPASDAPSCPSCAEQPGDAHLTDDPWVPREQRVAATWSDLALVDGDHHLAHAGDLMGKPTALTFVFSRCANPNKCPRAVAAMAALANQAHSAGIADRVHLGIVTYDPRYDTEQRLAAWTASKGVTSDLGVLLLRPSVDEVAKLVSQLSLGVSFRDDGAVATHDLELVIFDRQGRVSHRYHATIWDQALVMKDLQRLIAEPR